jgi:UDPglucose 6-dehydrogenase
VDNSAAVLDALRERRMPFPDPDLEGLLSASGVVFSGVLDAEAVTAPIVMLVVPTPPLPDGHADLSAIRAVVERIAEAIPDGAETLAVIKSTVPPGTTDAMNCRARALLKGKGSNARISFAANPEFLRQGSALADTLYPDRIVVGVDDETSEQRLRELYGPFLTQDFDAPAAAPRPEGLAEPPLISTRPVNAELIKYAANTFLATKLSFINEVARYAEKVNGDITDVARGIGLDPRIGPTYLQAGPGWGGPCLGKDTRALVAAAADVGAEMPVLSAVIESNADQREHIVERLEEGLGSLNGRTIGILGLSFKAGTDDTIDSPALDVAELLLKRGATVHSYDPLAEGRARRERPDLAIEYHQSVDGAFTGSDALVLMTDWPEFKTLVWSDVAARMQGKVIIDARNFLDRLELEAAGLQSYAIGR